MLDNLLIGNFSLPTFKTFHCTSNNVYAWKRHTCQQSLKEVYQCLNPFFLYINYSKQNKITRNSFFWEHLTPEWQWSCLCTPVRNNTILINYDTIFDLIRATLSIYINDHSFYWMSYNFRLLRIRWCYTKTTSSPDRWRRGLTTHNIEAGS